MAAGYATARPPLHGRILALALHSLQLPPRAKVAADIGCGSGLSTKPLVEMSQLCVGIEPVAGMLRWAPVTAPGAAFAVARAESLPFREASVDLMTAAGSLNYTDLLRFFGEARRVLRPQGALVVYDFSQGKSFRDSAALDEWHSEFMRRYPHPPGESRRDLDVGILSGLDSGMRMRGGQDFELGLQMTAGSYTAYVMTETNVSYAVAVGAGENVVRQWCDATLREVFGGEAREVLFRGYFAGLGR